MLNERKIATKALAMAKAELIEKLTFLQKNYPDVFTRGVEALVAESPEPAKIRHVLQDESVTPDKFVEIMQSYANQNSLQEAIKMLASNR